MEVPLDRGRVDGGSGGVPPQHQPPPAQPLALPHSPSTEPPPQAAGLLLLPMLRAITPKEINYHCKWSVPLPTGGSGSGLRGFAEAETGPTVLQDHGHSQRHGSEEQRRIPGGGRGAARRGAGAGVLLNTHRPKGTKPGVGTGARSSRVAPMVHSPVRARAGGCVLGRALGPLSRGLVEPSPCRLGQPPILGFGSVARHAPPAIETRSVTGHQNHPPALRLPPDTRPAGPRV